MAGVSRLEAVRGPALVALCIAVVAGGCGDSDPQSQKELVVVVNAPFSTSAYVGDALANGAELAAAGQNAIGGIVVDNVSYTLKIRRMDTALSPS